MTSFSLSDLRVMDSDNSITSYVPIRDSWHDARWTIKSFVTFLPRRALESIFATTLDGMLNQLTVNAGQCLEECLLDAISINNFANLDISSATIPVISVLLEHPYHSRFQFQLFYHEDHQYPSFRQTLSGNTLYCYNVYQNSLQKVHF